MEKTTANILWVSDNFDPVIYNLLRKSLPDVEVYVVSPDSGYLNYIKDKNIQIILLECNLKGRNTIDVLEAIQKIGHDILVIVLGECENEEIAIELMRKGAYNYILRTEKFTNILPVVVEKAFMKCIESEKKRHLELQLKNSVKIESIHDGVCMINRDFQIVMANNSLLNQFKGEAGEVIGKRCYEIFHGSSKPCEGDEHLCPTREVFGTGKPVNIIHCHLSKGGDKVFVEMNAHPVINEKGEITHVVEILRDITEKKKMEEKILEQEKLSVLIEMAGATAHELNQPLTVIMPRLELFLTKANKDDPLLKDMTIIYGQCEKMADLIKKISEVTVYQTKEYVGDVNIIDIEKASNPSIMKAKNSPHNLLESLLVSMNQYSVIVTDLSGTIIYFNKYSEDLLGYTAEEVVQKKDVLFFSKEEGTSKGIEACRAPAIYKGYYEREKTVITKDGNEITIDLCFAPLLDKKSQVAGFVGVAQHTSH